MTTVNPTSTPTLPGLTLGGDPSKFSSLLAADAGAQTSGTSSTTPANTTPSGPFNLGDASTWPPVGGTLPSGYAWGANGLPYDINNPPASRRLAVATQPISIPPAGLLRPLPEAPGNSGLRRAKCSPLAFPACVKQGGRPRAQRRKTGQGAA